VPSTFGGVSTALSALIAQRRGLDIAGQNIANANNDGYSRQRVELQSVGGTLVPALFAVGDGVAGGVAVTDIVRVRDAFLSARERTEHAESAYLTDRQRVYGQLERLVAEPSDTGLQAQLADLWGSWHDVANNPGDLAARSQLLQQADTVAASLNRSTEALGALWMANREQLGALATDINGAAARIAELNQAVVRAEAAGLASNELADQRDQLVLHLAELTGARALPRANGSVDVLFGGAALVSGSVARQVRAAGAGQLDGLALDPVALQWTDTGAAIGIPSGQVASVLETLGTTLPQHLAGLDQIAATLVSTVNAQHTAGYDRSGTAGGAFFTGSTAASIAVAITDPSRVAAAAVTGGGLDGGNADRLAGLAGSVTGADHAYRQLVAGLGATAQTVNQRASSQASLTAAADAATAAHSGVNLDEEMTNLITFQRGYEAAARVLNIVDSVLDTLINHTAR
jgi:flagellar hook-associated protein 1